MRPLDQAIAALARRQHGVISAAQLAELGVSQRAVSHRVEAGRLHRVHRGVYAVGHTVLGPYGRWMAAVLACGPGAALSHTSAGALWDIRRSDAVRIDVTVPTDAGRKPRAGLTVHRARRLRPDEVTTHHGIPVTTAARTLLDLAGKLSERRLHRALDQAEIERLTDYPSLDALARAHPGHKGAGKLRRAVRVHTAGTTLTRSELEELFLKLCRRHGLPQPQVNEYVGEFLVDFVFAPDRLVIETDSWRYHRTRQAFERDRRRDWTLARAGYRTLRFTDRQLVDEPREVAQALLAALRQGGAA